MTIQRKPTREEKIQLFSFATKLDPKSKGPMLSKSEKAKISAMTERANCLNIAQSLNGPNNYIDRKFREFVREYNNRVFMGHGSDQPESFNILKNFVEPDEKALVLGMLKETHYSLDVNFVFDVITDPNRNRNTSELLKLEEAKIYSVSVSGGYEDLIFAGVKGLALFGWSFVRHGNELFIFALSAKDDPDRGNGPIEKDKITANPDKPFLSAETKINFDHDVFYDHESLFPVVFLTGIDLNTSTSIVRYILTERKDAFAVVSDDRERYTYLTKGPMRLPPDEVSKIFDDSHRTLSEHAHFFALLSELPHAVLDIEDNEALKIVRVPTEISFNSNKTSIRKLKAVLSSEESPNFVDVRTINLPLQPSRAEAINVVGYKVEQTGYWKHIEYNKYGIGKNGDKILGKTWVTVHESWEESLGFTPPENSNIVLVQTGAGADEVGEIYVLRSAQHPKDVYKIGYTTKSADSRASQLESTSGQPDHFGVMNTWRVKYPRRVESVVHERFAQHRVSSRREFFKIKYRVIQQTIGEIIAELNASSE